MSNATLEPEVPADRQAKAPPQEGEILAPAHDLVPTTQPPVPALHRSRRRWWRMGLLTLIVIGAGGGGAYWWLSRPPVLPAGIVASNGRVEAMEVDIATKFQERVAQLFADEGDVVSPGQVVARMDTRDIEASLKKAEAQVRQAQRLLEEARANVSQQQTQQLLAQQELDRTSSLVARGFATHELLDQRRQALNGASDALRAANERVNQAEHALDAVSHDVELYKVNIADNALQSPTIGRIQYRIANIGEVLPVGGKVFTMLDFTNVYMDIYLPTAAAGKARVGSEARIVLDAYPHFAVPAHVSFIATQAQFTPKAVETKEERDKLMFRVKVRIDQNFLLPRAAEVRTGLPGIAYVRLDPAVEWPAALRGPAAQ